MEIKKDLIISDLDGTLTKKSLVLEHYGYLINNDIVEDDGTYKEVSSQKGYHRTVTGCLRAIADMFRESLSNDHFEQIDELIEREKMFQSVMEDFMKKHKSSLERLSDVD